MFSMSDTVEELIIEYVERQQKVVEIVRLLRPDLFLRAIGDKSIDEFYSCFDTKLNEVRLPKCGVIDDEYSKIEYWFHGNGCRLDNMKTGEPLEWDEPNQYVFDIYWFINWVEWFITTEEAVSILPKFKDDEGNITIAIKKAIQQLTELGKVENRDISLTKFILNIHNSY